MQSIHEPAADALDGAPVDPTSVYRYYDHHGLLLYVGITKQRGGRNLQHNSTAEWWPFVERQEIEHHPSRESASAREKLLIRTFRPPFNRQHNLDGANLREAYLAFAANPVDSMTAQAIYEALPSAGSPRRPGGRYPGRWLPLDIVYQTEDSVVLRTNLHHAPLAAALRLSGAGVAVFHASNAGKPAGTITDLERTGNFTLLTCVTTPVMPVLVETAKARLKWVGAAKPPAQIQHILLDAEGPAVG